MDEKIKWMKIKIDERNLFAIKSYVNPNITSSQPKGIC